jgi:hypothetical protein
MVSRAKAAVEEVNAEADLASGTREEYASVTVSIDHLILSDDTHGHTVVKNVWSTESAVESLLAQVDYFGDASLLRDAATLDMIARGNHHAAVFVYTANEGLTNVIVDAQVWSDTLANEELSQGTVLGAHAALIALATDLKRTAQSEGKDGRILAFITD